jgi:hypothetical protein
VDRQNLQIWAKVVRAIFNDRKYHPIDCAVQELFHTYSKMILSEMEQYPSASSPTQSALIDPSVSIRKNYCRIFALFDMARVLKIMELAHADRFGFDSVQHLQKFLSSEVEAIAGFKGKSALEIPGVQTKRLKLRDRCLTKFKTKHFSILREHAEIIVNSGTFEERCSSRISGGFTKRKEALIACKDTLEKNLPNFKFPVVESNYGGNSKAKGNQLARDCKDLVMAAGKAAMMSLRGNGDVQDDLDQTHQQQPLGGSSSPSDDDGDGAFSSRPSSNSAARSRSSSSSDSDSDSSARSRSSSEDEEDDNDDEEEEEEDLRRDPRWSSKKRSFPTEKGGDNDEAQQLTVEQISQKAPKSAKVARKSPNDQPAGTRTSARLRGRSASS